MFWKQYRNFSSLEQQKSVGKLKKVFCYSACLEIMESPTVIPLCQLTPFPLPLSGWTSEGTALQRHNTEISKQIFPE
jgi:hypothetical protein